MVLNRKLPIFLTAIFLFSIFHSLASDNRIPIYFDALNIEELYDQFKKNDTVSTTYHQIYIKLTNHISKIKVEIEEKGGRDVKLILNLSKEYIPPERFGKILSDYEIPATIYFTENQTQIILPLDAFQKIEFSISKLNILSSKISSSFGRIFGRKVIHTTPSKDQKEVAVFIPKSIVDDLDVNRIIVTYQTSFYGWYKKASKSLKADVSYSLRDLGKQYEVVINFKTEPSSLRVYTFSNSIMGRVGYHLTRVKVEMASAIIEWFGD